MANEMPTYIKSRHGEMFLMEHHGTDPSGAVWVVSLNSGLQNRTGPRRLYLHFARAVADLGYCAVRVDLPGVGDSDGPKLPTHFDCYDPEDVVTVVDYLTKTYNPKAILVHGLCAGARVAIKAAALDDRVSGVVAWSTTIYTPTPGSTRPPEEPKHGVSTAVAKHNKQRASSLFADGKIVSLSFWKRYLSSGKVMADMRSIFWSFWMLLTGEQKTDHKTRFILALNGVIDGGKPIHFTYGDRDQPCFGEFQELELDIPEDALVVIPGGTHTFSTLRQREQALAGSCEWIRRFSDRVPA